MVVIHRIAVVCMHCNLVATFSVVQFACKILDACVFAMNFCAFCMIIENKRKNLAQQHNEIMQSGRTQERASKRETRQLAEQAKERHRSCVAMELCKASNESQIVEKNLVSHIMAALLALFSFNFIVELHAEAILNLKTLKE